MTRIPIDDEEPAGGGDDEQVLEEAAPGQGEPNDSNELPKLRAERDMLYERLARAQADFQNSRKRLEAESDQRVQYANAALIKSLLPVIDNFERALAQDPDKTNTRDVLRG